MYKSALKPCCRAVCPSLPRNQVGAIARKSLPASSFFFKPCCLLPSPAPRNQVGAIARESLPASHAEYATEASRVELARYFRRC